MAEQHGHVADATEAAEPRQCRYCLSTAENEGDLVAPCGCSGGQRWVHLECLRRWQRSVLVTQPTHPAHYGDDLRMTHCGVCTQRFTCPPPTRHEMMLGFTGAELAALVEESSLICASQAFSVNIRARLHAHTHRGSISSFVHWCQGVYLIYYAGPKRMVLNLPDEANRAMLLEAVGPSGLVHVHGHRCRLLCEGPLASVQQPRVLGTTDPRMLASRGPSTTSDATARCRGVEWVEHVVHGRLNTASMHCSIPTFEDTNGEGGPLNAAAEHDDGNAELGVRIREAIALLPVPVELTLVPEGPDACNASEDTIRALNLNNCIAPHDLSDEARDIVRQATRLARQPQRLLAAIEIRHHLGGPCALTQCVALVPVGGADGIRPPFPAGFKVLPQLGVAVTADLAVAMRALAEVREPVEGECSCGRPVKRRRVQREPLTKTESCSSAQSTALGSKELGCQTREVTVLTGDEIVDDQLLEEGEGEVIYTAFGGESSDNQDSDVNAAEFAASPPPSSSSGGESLEAGSCDSVASDDIARHRTDADDMVVGLAAESIIKAANSLQGVDSGGGIVATTQTSSSTNHRPLLVFWGESRWQRTQLLGELARGDWGLCSAGAGDLWFGPGLWHHLAVEKQQPVYAPPSEMSREAAVDEPTVHSTLGRLIAAHQETSRQQEQQRERQQETPPE